MAVTLYRQVGKGKARRYQRVNLGRGRPPTDLSGPYFLRYSHADGTRPWESVGDDLDAAIDAQKRKQAYLKPSMRTFRSSKTTTNPVGRKSLMPFFSGSPSFNFFRAKTNRARAKRHCEHNYRLGFFLDFTAQQNLRFLDQIDRNQLLRYVKFLREHDSDLDDRTVAVAADSDHSSRDGR